MGNTKRLRKNKQQAMYRRMKGSKRPMTDEQKIARKKEKDIQVAACKEGILKAKPKKVDSGIINLG